MKQHYIEKMTLIHWYTLDKGNGFIELENELGQRLLLRMYMLDEYFTKVQEGN